MYLLDTDILTLVHRNHPRVALRQKSVESSEVATSIVTWMEILEGRFAAVLKATDGEQLLLKQELLRRTEEKFRDIRIIAFDKRAAEEFDRLRQHKKLKSLGRNDMLIASIARAINATLVSRNLRDFKSIPGLRVENWAD